jgi:glycosyltransferase involved in cell wall biosynthesis
VLGLVELPPAPPRARWPLVSVIVPARDEAKRLPAALGALLDEGYPALEVVAVDDRSQDNTGALLDARAATDARLRVVHVRALPEGWLGKSYATACAAELAGGEWLLFTDADVHFSPGVIARAVALCEARRLDHLALWPRLEAPGLWERALGTLVGLLVLLRLRPWALGRAGSRAFAGVGAFNLVRRDAYARAGGHAPLAMEIVDDLKLGLILRRSGARQALGDSGGLLRLRWYDGFWATLAGLGKNSFAASEWRWTRALAVTLLVALGSLGPALALYWPGSRWPGLALLLPSLVLHAAWARRTANASGLEALLLPLVGAALAGAFVAGALAATLRRAIVWRGTRYPLDALKARCVRARDHSPEAAVGWR